MNIIGFIPARYGSTRFFAKPLADIMGKPMIQMVYEQVKKSKKLDKIVVLTDNDEVYKTVEKFGANVYMTAETCTSGTERIQSVLNAFDCDIAVNIQGDEPLVDAQDIDRIVDVLLKNPGISISTLASQIKDTKKINNPNIVKVVLNSKNEALYFSRSTIPYIRDENADVIFYQHIGLYGYRTDIVKSMDTLPNTMLKDAEMLEQLLFLENGYNIQVVLTDNEYIGVDTKEDLEKVIDKLKVK